MPHAETQSRGEEEFAKDVHLSLDTIRTHLRHIYEKLHVNSRTEVVLKLVGR